MICPYCQSKIKSKKEAIICPVCGTPHHIDCWNENGGCTTYGCTGKSEDVGNLTVEEIENLKSHIAPQTENAEPEENKFQQELETRIAEKKKVSHRKIIPYISMAVLACLIIFSIAFTFVKVDEYINSEEYKVSRFLSDWRKAWTNKDLAGYESLLDKDYLYIEDGKSIKKDERLKRIETSFKSKDDIDIGISKLKMKFDSTSANYVNVNFVQTYKSGKIMETGSKTLRLYRGEETLYRWKIYREYFDKY